MALRAAALLAVTAAAINHAGCETLYNGIVLPDQWPPRVELTNRTYSTPW